MSLVATRERLILFCYKLLLSWQAKVPVVHVINGQRCVPIHISSVHSVDLNQAMNANCLPVTHSIPRLQRWEFKSFFCQMLNTIWNIGWFNLVSIIWIMTDCYPSAKAQHQKRLSRFNLSGFLRLLEWCKHSILLR